MRWAGPCSPVSSDGHPSILVRRDRPVSAASSDGAGGRNRAAARRCPQGPAANPAALPHPQGAPRLEATVVIAWSISVCSALSRPAVRRPWVSEGLSLSLSLWWPYPFVVGQRRCHKEDMNWVPAQAGRHARRSWSLGRSHHLQTLGGLSPERCLLPPLTSWPQQRGTGGHP